MIRIYSDNEITKIAQGGKILAQVFDELRHEIRPGVRLDDLDKIAHLKTIELGGEPAFLNYQPNGASHPYSASICTSVNDVVVHGLPSDYKLKEGDLLSVDFGVKFDGYYSDAAFSIIVTESEPCGEPQTDAEKLVEATHRALNEAIKYCKPGHTLGDVGWAIEGVAKKYSVKVVSGLTGHGVGKSLHEDPDIYNIGERGQGIRIQKGMVLAIEPMFALGTNKVIQKKDESWATVDGSLSAHFEHTIAITEKGNRILT